MKLIVFIIVSFLLFTACVKDEEGENKACLTTQDCPVGYECDPVTGKCVEEGTVVKPDNDGFIPGEQCNGHGALNAQNLCECDKGYGGSECGECAMGYTGYPDCEEEGEACKGVNCNDHGKCLESIGGCSCYTGYAGEFCDQCEPGYEGYPNCVLKLCEPGTLSCRGLVVVECNETGTDFIDKETCSGEGVVCYKGKCLDACGIAAEDKSYVGCEYWGAFLQQIDENEGGTYALVVANPNATGVNVKIYTMGDTLIAENTVPAKGLYSFELGGSRKIPSAGISDLGFKLVSSKPVTVTQMNPFGNVLIYSNDATLLLPVGALAEKYYAMSWPGWSSLSGFVSIVAVQDGITTVKVTYTATSVAGAGVNAEGPGSVVSYSLNKYQILTLNSTTAANSNSYGADLTGSYIQADQKIAVFGGHVCTRIPANQQACDHMEHQIFPLQSWGKDFVAGRTKPRGGENDYFRILASENDTVVSWTGGLTGGVTLQAGWYHDFNTNTDFMIHSEKPILVGQFLASQDAGAGTGDPAMMLVAPNEQLRKDYIFLVPPNYDYNRITIIAIKDTNIEVNGQSYSSNSFMNIPGTDWYKGWVDMTTGAYTLTASKPVGLYVYGFSQYVSYAYTAGLDLKVINQQE